MKVKNANDVSKDCDVWHMIFSIYPSRREVMVMDYKTTLKTTWAKATA